MASALTVLLLSCWLAGWSGVSGHAGSIPTEGTNLTQPGMTPAPTCIGSFDPGGTKLTQPGTTLAPTRPGSTGPGTSTGGRKSPSTPTVAGPMLVCIPLRELTQLGASSRTPHLPTEPAGEGGNQTDSAGNDAGSHPPRQHGTRYQYWGQEIAINPPRSRPMLVCIPLRELTQLGASSRIPHLPMEPAGEDAGSIPSEGTDPTRSGAMPASTCPGSMGPGGSEPSAAPDLTRRIMAGVSAAAAGLLLLLLAFLCYRSTQGRKAPDPRQSSRESNAAATVYTLIGEGKELDVLPQEPDPDYAEVDTQVL
ncbi:unnamed protein product [Eretmochelys imbricata]